MCAIFGFIARGKTSISPAILQRIVRANIARGPHSFGFSWIDADGRQHCYKQRGRLTDHLSMLAIARNARTLIGHLRYATHGSPDRNINNHPHPADGGWFVHNGVIRNHEELLESHEFNPVTECDSETLGLLIEHGSGTLLNRCANAIEETDGSLAMLGLWARPASLVVGRRGNPLHLTDGPEGIYFSTLASGLTGKNVQAIRDNTARVYTRDGTAIRCKMVKIVPEYQSAGALFDEDGAYRGG